MINLCQCIVWHVHSISSLKMIKNITSEDQPEGQKVVLLVPSHIALATN